MTVLVYAALAHCLVYVSWTIWLKEAFWSFLMRKFTVMPLLEELGKPRQNSKLGGTALIAGGSIAGLFCARVLCTHFEKVVIIESERIPQGDKRSHVGQYHFAHAGASCRRPIHTSLTLKQSYPSAYTSVAPSSKILTRMR